MGEKYNSENLTLMELLSAVIHQLPGVVCLKDSKGVFLQCNDAFVDLADGFSREDILGKSDKDMPWRDQAEENQKNDQETISTGESLFFIESDRISKKIPISIEKNQKPLILVVSIHLPELILETKDLYSKLEEIISVLPGHVYWKNQDCVLQGCNEEQARDAGLKSRHDIVGKTAYDILLQDQPEADKLAQAKITDEIDREIMNNDNPQSVDEFVVGPNGEIIFYWSRKVPLHDEKGNVNGLVGVSIDITEKKKLEEELTEMAERYKSFVSNQEHDILTPFSGLVGSSDVLMEMIEEEGCSPEVKKMAGNINACCNGLLNYQKSLLDTLYLFNDKNELYNRRFEFRTYMDDIADMFLCSIKEKGLEFSLTIDDSIPDFLRGDNFRLRNCLVRLLSNAVKYTEKGEIKIDCRRQKTKRKNEILLDINVEDTGVGIAEDELEVIFEPFSRLTLSNIGKYEGRGVGLSFVKKMIDELHGEIDATSEVGKGSVFRLIFSMQQSLVQDHTSKPKG